jgi:hypothetical protein
MPQLNPADREWAIRNPHDGGHLVLMTTDSEPLTAADADWVTAAIQAAQAAPNTADPVRGAVGPAQREVDKLTGE